MMKRNHTFEGDVPKLTKWLYTSSGMFRDGCYQFVSMFLLTFVQFCALGGVSFEEYLAMFGGMVLMILLWDLLLKNVISRWESIVLGF